MAAGRHYGPGAWQNSLARADWSPPYYHRADAQGIGFNRTSSGSNAVAQYAPPLASRFEQLQSTPEQYLLWFHHVPWTYRLQSGRTLWDELVMHYTHGVAVVHGMRALWATLAPYIDAQRYAQTGALLKIQEQEAQWWRDATLAYFQSISKLPFPAGFAPPARTLEEYQAIK
jgi:alpha-glucuronidase